MMRVLMLAFVFLVTSCSFLEKTESNLSSSDLKYIKSLVPLDKDERILLFESNGGGLNPVEMAGNFITNKRVAHYWIDDNEFVRQALFKEIDSIKVFDRSTALTYASYAEVFTVNSSFKVYVDAEKKRESLFFNLLDSLVKSH